MNILFDSPFVSRNKKLKNIIRSLSGLVRYYPMDELSGSAINRAPSTIGTGNGTVSGPTRGEVGRVGRAYGFDGVNDVVHGTGYQPTVAANQSFGIFCFFTIPTGVYSADLTLAGAIHEGGANDPSIAAQVDDTSGKLSIFFRDDASNSTGYAFPETASLIDNSWHFIYIERNGSDAKYYLSLDGNYHVGEKAFTDTQTITLATAMQVGARNARGTSDQFFKGKLQHFGILYNQVISQGKYIKIAKIAGFI